MTRRFDTAGGPHVPAPSSVQWMMRQVLYALTPGLASYVWFFGPGILIQIVIATVAALGFEWAMLRMRGKPIAPFLTDLSVPITAALYCLCLPPLMSTLR